MPLAWLSHLSRMLRARAPLEQPRPQAEPPPVDAEADADAEAEEAEARLGLRCAECTGAPVGNASPPGANSRGRVCAASAGGSECVLPKSRCGLRLRSVVLAPDPAAGALGGGVAGGGGAGAGAHGTVTGSEKEAPSGSGLSGQPGLVLCATSGSARAGERERVGATRGERGDADGEGSCGWM